jgi:hypothetical protein
MSVKKFSAHELSNDQYHSDTSKLTGSQFAHLSSSGMKTLIESPQKYKETYIDGFQSIGGAALDLGSYVHALILEPHTVASDFAIWKGGVRRGGEWEEFRRFHHSKTIITEKDHELAQKMLRSFYDSKHATSLINRYEGEPEVSFLGEIDGVPVKCRADFLRTVPYKGDPKKGGAIVDIKTTSSPLTDDEVAQVCYKYSYELSSALYVDLLKEYDGVERSFYFVFISKHGECATRVWRASDRMLELGRMKYKRAIELYKDCLLNGFDRSTEPDEIPLINIPEHLYGASFGK